MRILLTLLLIIMMASCSSRSGRRIAEEKPLVYHMIDNGTVFEFVDTDRKLNTLMKARELTNTKTVKLVRVSVIHSNENVADTFIGDWIVASHPNVYAYESTDFTPNDTIDTIVETREFLLSNVRLISK